MGPRPGNVARGIYCILLWWCNFFFGILCLRLLLCPKYWTVPHRSAGAQQWRQWVKWINGHEIQLFIGIVMGTPEAGPQGLMGWACENQRESNYNQTMYRQEYVSSLLHWIRLQLRYNVKESQLYISAYNSRNKYESRNITYVFHEQIPRDSY